MQIKECNMLEVRDDRDGEFSGEEWTVSCWVGAMLLERVFSIPSQETTLNNYYDIGKIKCLDRYIQQNIMTQPSKQQLT